MSLSGIDLTETNCSIRSDKGSSEFNVDQKDWTVRPDYYLPKFAVTEAAAVQNVGLVATKNKETGKVLYSFTVEWSSTGVEAVPRIPTDRNKKPPAALDIGVYCDGPCGKLSFSEMKQYGDCDHNICVTCYDTEKSQGMFDGTAGCCNVDCVNRDLNIGDFICARSVKSNCSGISCNGVAQFVQLRILIFGKDQNGRISRKKIDREVSSNTRLRTIKSLLNKLVDDLDECQVYYSNTHFIEKKSLIRLAAFDNCHISSLLDGLEILNVIVTAPSVTLFRD